MNILRTIQNLFTGGKLKVCSKGRKLATENICWKTYTVIKNIATNFTCFYIRELNLPLSILRVFKSNFDAINPKFNQIHRDFDLDYFASEQL